MTSLAETAPTISTPHLTHPKYRPDIDGLRAIAVMSVVLFHAFPMWLPGGFIGVDIFFIISGYLISTIIYGSLERQAFSFTEFYARRIKRIFPALLLVLISCYAFGWFTLFADEFQQLGKHIAGGSAFISNFVLWDESGYFDTTAEIKPLLHLWSLGIEEQFYIIWPLVLWAAWKVRLNVLTITLACLGVSFILNMINIGADPSATFYMPQTRAWELLAGSIMAYVTAHHGAQSRAAAERFINTVILRPGTRASSASIRNAQSFIGLALLAVGFAVVTSAGFPGWQAIIPCAGAILMISAGPHAWLNRKILSSKLFVWVGLISFPLYLWHWPLLSFARIIEGDVPALEIRIAAVITAIVLAWLTYKLVELPLRRREWPLKTAALVLVMAAVGFAGYRAFELGGFPERANIVSAKMISEQYTPATDLTFIQNETCLNRYKFEEAKGYFWFCVTNHDTNPSIVILGNSYANHLYSGLIQALPKETILSIGVCDPGMPDSSSMTTGPCSESKPKRQADFIDSIIKTSGTVKTVIIDIHHSPRTKTYVDKLKSRIAYMEGLGIKVVIFIPHLTLDYNVKTCFARPLKPTDHDCMVSKEKYKELMNGLSDEIADLKSSFSNVYFFDQNEVFKTEHGYSMIIDGMPAFRDEFSHFSKHASFKVGQAFLSWAKENNLGL